MTEKEKIDHDLKNRIIEVFDEYNDPHANEGWDLLRQKYPAKNNKRLAAWPWYAAAAIILLFLGVWLIQEPADNNFIAKKRVKVVTDKNNQHVIPAQPDTQIIARENPQQTFPNKKSTYLQPYTTTQKQMPANVLVKQVTPAVTAVKLKTDSSNSNNVVGQKNTATEQLTNNNNAESTSDNVIASGNKQALTETPEKHAAENMDRLLNEKTAEKKTPLESSRISKRQIFSVYAGTHLSYAEGSNNQLNMGAGVASDFRISKRLKISAGLAIAQNRLSYNNNSASNSAVNQKIFGSVAPTAAVEQNFASSSVRTFGLAAAAPVLPVLKKYNASLVGLDVPVSIKYELNPDKGQAYVTAGFSSGTFINETYTSSYSLLQKTQENTTKSSFSGFNIAKTLDFSFGWGYSLGKSNMLIVEPFLKYPINGAGTEQIKFGMSGINLKLGFKR